MLFQFLPRLADDEYAALEKSIVEHGIQVPIVVDENRAVIDGHHRKEIADRLGIECPRRFAMDLTDEQKRTLALSLNLDRRHLSREQKRTLVEASVKADPHLSDRQHAERTGVDHKTVGTRRSDLEARGEIPHVGERTDSTGRTQPATKPTFISATEALAELTDEAAEVVSPDETVDVETGEIIPLRHPLAAVPDPAPAPRRVPRPAAERTLALIQSQAAKAAREAQALTPDQIRRVRAEADHVVASLRNSIEVLQHLANSLDNKESK